MSGHGVVATVLGIVGCGMLLCRVDKMLLGHTRLEVFLQHAALAVALFASIILQFTEFEDWAPAAMYAGVVAFLLFGTGRWRHGPPPGTTRPNEGPELGGAAGAGGD